MSKLLSSLNVGDKVKIGSIYGNPIIWRIVAKNHTGYPSSSTTLLTDKIIKICAVDGKESGNPDTNRANYGNNRYKLSNIRQWMNKDSAAGQWYVAQHSYDQPPTKANSNTYNGYDTAAGFLNGFTQNEKNAILSTTYKVGVAPFGGDSNTVEELTDKIFLPSPTEVGLTSDFSGEGTSWGAFANDAARQANCTADAKTNSDYSVSEPWYWWLRSPYVSYSTHVRRAYSSGALSPDYAYLGHIGLRPACNLSSSLLVSDSTDGDGSYTIIYNAPPSMPVITAPSSVAAGQTVNISWTGSTDPEGKTVGYKLERKASGGSWTQIYAGSALSYQDTIDTSWSTVQWRVKAYDGDGIESSYSESTALTVQNNTAPSVPTNFVYPSSIHGGDNITLSWGASTDPQGNAIHYEVERNLDSQGWNQVYSGNALTTNNDVPVGTNTVQYRVKAVDSVGASSAYATGTQINVINNEAPTIPTSITVPNTVYVGIPFNVSWGASTDPDGDTITYYLERKIGNGAWTSIYNSSTILQVSQTPESSWGSVQYRVRAGDGQDYSDYKTQTSASTIVDDTPPSVSGNDGNLGELDDWPGYDYAVGDPDGDTLTVTEKISGSLVRTFTVTSDHFLDTQTFEMATERWNQLSYGDYNITIEVSDGRGGTSTRTMTFHKNRSWNVINLSLVEFKRPTVTPMPYGLDDTMGVPIIGRPYTKEPHRGIPTPNMDYNSILPWIRERPVKVYNDTRIESPETNFGVMVMSQNTSVLVQSPFFSGQRFKVTAGWEETNGTATIYLGTMQDPDAAHVISYGTEMEFIAIGDDDASRGRSLRWVKYPLTNS